MELGHRPLHVAGGIPLADNLGAERGQRHGVRRAARRGAAGTQETRGQTHLKVCGRAVVVRQQTAEGVDELRVGWAERVQVGKKAGEGHGREVCMAGAFGVLCDVCLCVL